MMPETKISRRMSHAAEPDGLTDRCRHAAQATVDEYPLTTTMGAFAVGLTLGVLAGAALAQPFHRSHRRTAESLGQRMLDVMREYMPQSVNQYLHG
jgi:hypothetical protein